jgi:oxygen-independent coproporphyrinogen-3 oxidase
MGVSAISAMPGGFSQNHVKLEDYYRDLEVPRLPIARGVALNDDDRLRGEVIQQLICNNTLETRDIETRFGMDFNSYFATELKQLQLMAQDGLIKLGDHRLDVTARGRLLIRNVCKVFDHYRVEQEEKFSKMI